MLKRNLFFLVILMFALSLTGCMTTEKTFSGNGVTITLDSSFVETEVVQAPFCLQSTEHIFMAIREDKSQLSLFGIDTLDQYIETVLKNANKTAKAETFAEGDVLYKYAYYISSVNDQTFGYMLVVMEGKDDFYTMNFGCLQKNLEGNKEQYKKWAKTIIVE